MALQFITDVDFLGDIDLNKKELQNAVIQVLGTKPGSPAQGQIFYDSDVDQIQVYNGSIWQGLVTETVDTDHIFNTTLKVGRDADNLIDFTTDNQITFRVSTGNNVIFKASGEIEATSLDISGAIDVDGTSALAAVTATTGVFSGILKTDDTTAATSTTDGSLQTDGGLSVAADAVIGDDLILISDAAVLSLGAGKDVTITHDNGTGGTLASAGNFVVDSTAGTMTIDGHTGLTLQSAADIALVAGGNDITIDSDTLVITSSTADFPLVKLLNTTNDDQASQLYFEKLRADDATAQGQNLGEIWFRGQNDNQQFEEYGFIIGEIDVGTDGQESGVIKIGVAAHDGDAHVGLEMTGAGSNNTVDMALGFGTSSVTTLAGTLTMGSTAAMGNTGLLTVGAQTGITATANLVTVGALNAGTITSGFGNIDNGSATLDTGAATVASLVIGGHSIDDIDITAEFVDADAHIMSSKAIGARFALKNADTTGTATNATNAAHVAIANTESGNEENELTFVENAAAGGANRGLESSAKATFNPGSGAITATSFIGKLTIGAHALDDVNINTEFVDADDTLMTAKAIGHRFSLKAGSTSIVTTGVLNAGSINTSFGNINNGASTITTTGLISGGSLDIDDVLINGSNIGHTDDTDLIALADGAVTVNGSLTVTGTTTTNNVETVSTSSGVIFEGAAADGHDATLTSVVASSDKTYTLPNTTGHIAIFTADPGTTNVTATTAELNALDLGSTAVGNAIASKAVVLDSSKDFTGLNSITSDNFVIGGHTINDIDITSEFVDDNAHIMSSKAIGARFSLKAGSTSITTLGTIGTGVWNGTKIASAYLDDDTAHLAGAQTFTGTKTLNSFKGTAGATVTNILDEDAMGSDSATALATQQSIKAYVDATGVAAREKVFILNNSVSGVASSDNVTYTVTHGLSSRNVMVEVIRNGANSGDFATIYSDIKRTSDDIITVVFGSARTAGDYTVMIRKIG